MPAPILIVDDDPAERRRLAEALAEEGHAVESFEDGAAALARLAAADGNCIRLIILDLVMPELDGVGVLRRLAEKGSRIKVIAQTTPAGADRVAEALRAGALDFLVKPASPERLAVSVRNALRLAALEEELARSHRAGDGTTGFDDIVATDPGMERALVLGRRASGSDLPVLIEGESGTGRALLARAIHGGGDRRGRPFVVLSRHAEDFDKDLFGVDREPGRIQTARQGTLLIEEIERLSPDAQARLMSLLATGMLEQSGRKAPLRPDIRLIATTSTDLQERVRAGLFREDLYYRLNVLPIRLPPLRARRDAIPELAARFVARAAAEHGRPARGIAPEALALLMRRSWSGNIRELETEIRRAVILAPGPELIAADLDVRPTDVAPALAEDREKLAAPEAPAVTGGLSALSADGDIRTLAEIETTRNRLALERYRGRMATVARKLGIGRSTLYRKLKELGISEGAEKIAAE